MLEDAYGNRFTYAHLGSVVRASIPVPKSDGPQAVPPVKAAAPQRSGAHRARPPRAASPILRLESEDEASAPATDDARPPASLPVKERLFAHPGLPGAKEAGGLEQTLDARARKSGKYETFDAYFSRPVRARPVEGPAAPPAARARG